MSAALRSIGRAARELLTLFVALGLVPLAPALGATYAELPWQAVALAGVWSASWYAWLWGRLHGPL